MVFFFYIIISSTLLFDILPEVIFPLLSCMYECELIFSDSFLVNEFWSDIIIIYLILKMPQVWTVVSPLNWLLYLFDVSE